MKLSIRVKTSLNSPVGTESKRQVVGLDDETSDVSSGRSIEDKRSRSRSVNGFYSPGVCVLWCRFSRYSHMRTQWLLTFPRSWPQTSTPLSSPPQSTTGSDSCCSSSSGHYSGSDSVYSCVQGSVWDGEGFCGSCWKSLWEEHREFWGVRRHGQEGTTQLFFTSFDESCLFLMSRVFLSQCGVLKEKLDSLLKTLNEESQASTVLSPAPPPTIAEEQEEIEGIVLPPLPPPPPHAPLSSAPCSTWANMSSSAAIFKPREQLMLRANSLKKAIRQIIEHTEKGTTHAHTCSCTSGDERRLTSVLVFSAVDEQNAQTQQQQVFSLSRAEEDEDLVEEEEEEELEEDKMSLQSSHSNKQHNTRRGDNTDWLQSLRIWLWLLSVWLNLSVFSVSKTHCEKLISKGSLSLGSSASLPVQTGSRENMPTINTKILYPGESSCHGNNVLMQRDVKHTLCVCVYVCVCVCVCVSGSLSSSSVISRLLVNTDPFSCDPDNM